MSQFEEIPSPGRGFQGSRALGGLAACKTLASKSRTTVAPIEPFELIACDEAATHTHPQLRNQGFRGGGQPYGDLPAGDTPGSPA